MNTPRLTLDQLREKLNKPQRKAQGHEESDIQIACVEWFRYQYQDLVLFAIPNGGQRKLTTVHTKHGTKDLPLEAKRMKDEGVLAGVSDLMLMKANRFFHGLFIEMKTDKGKQSDTQKAFEVKAKREGYAYATCRSFDDFQKAVTDYLNG